MSEVTVIPRLTTEEDNFCLAIIEYGGNIGASYRSAFGEKAASAIIRGQELLSRPEIAARIQQLHKLVDEHAHISLGSHLAQLAEIRDLAKNANEFKTALAAEQTRGQVAGFYQGKTNGKPLKDQSERAAVIINIGSTPANTDDWSKKYGKPPITIDVEAREK